MEAAIKFFSEEGFDGSTHKFAKKIGITQPLIYRYLDSKDELIREIYNAVFEGRWKSEWEEMLRDRTKTITTRLHEFYGLYTDVVFARDWMRIYLFSGLRELDINRWWSSFVESRIFVTICDELRYETGAFRSVNGSDPSGNGAHVEFPGKLVLLCNAPRRIARNPYGFSVILASGDKCVGEFLSRGEQDRP